MTRESWAERRIPDRASIAQALGVSERTLHRKLDALRGAAEGGGFQREHRPRGLLMNESIRIAGLLFDPGIALVREV